MYLRIVINCDDVEGKNEEKIAKSSNKIVAQFDAAPDQTVSEGSNVILNGHRFTTDRVKASYSWSHISPRNYDINIANADSPNASFKAPYILDNGDKGDIKASITLSFQLTVSDSKGVSSKNVNIKVKRFQRAMIFQAAVALGAYEAGVFRALVEKTSSVAS